MANVRKENGELKANIYLPPEVLQKCYDGSVAENRCTDELIACFYKIAEHLEKPYNCINKIDADACINYAVEQAWIKWNKYDPTRGDLFSFYTSIIYNDLRIYHNKRVKYNKDKISIDSLMDGNKD